MVASRCPCRPRRLAMLVRLSTSAAVRYSRLRQYVLGRLRGGGTRWEAASGMEAGVRDTAGPCRRGDAGGWLAIELSRHTFPKRAREQCATLLCKHLYPQGRGRQSFPKTGFLGRVDPSRTSEGEKDQNQILRLAGGTPGPYRRFSHGCGR